MATKKTTAKKAKAAPVKKAAAKGKAKAAPKKTPAAKTVPAAPVAVKAPRPSRPYFGAFGKRKTSIASVRLYKEGKGTITINERAFENYFPVFVDQDKIHAPLRMTATQKMFDISVQVAGGGIHSQADAVRHGISRALLEYDAGLRTTLKSAGFLTRDSRVKERKKYGLHRARRAPQFSKR